MERGWKNFKEHDRKRLQCLEQSVSKDVNNLLLRTQKEIEGVRRENIHGLREYLNPQEQTVGISQDSRPLLPVMPPHAVVHMQTHFHLGTPLSSALAT